jgi:hypothetical protein
LGGKSNFGVGVSVSVSDAVNVNVSSAPPASKCEGTPNDGARSNPQGGGSQSPELSILPDATIALNDLPNLFDTPPVDTQPTQDSVLANDDNLITQDSEDSVLANPRDQDSVLAKPSDSSNIPVTHPAIGGATDDPQRFPPTYEYSSCHERSHDEPLSCNHDTDPALLTKPPSKGLSHTPRVQTGHSDGMHKDAGVSHSPKPNLPSHASESMTAHAEEEASHDTARYSIPVLC